MAQSALSQPRPASNKGRCRHACTGKVGCLPREFDQFRNLTSEINEGDPALLERHVRNRGDDQTPTRRGHTGDRSVEVIYIAGSAWSTKRYMNMRPLYQPQVMQTGAVA